ncbi:hypothetical protein HHK36_029681 [Tetracentron sinense]|uniref:Uncharacterized protein n=1 Tax=Tetracentron sinense TaxID=13715 RepID=A0A835CZU8_TETSI|nr:hypothetical protein HHK36_029681 [Tetracentron sinense]
MEEEKAAAYYDELTRKGEGAARFKQGLGFSDTASNNAPSKGSALPSSSSFLRNFVRASSPGNETEFQKQKQLENIQNKLKKNQGSETHSRVPDSRSRDGSKYDLGHDSKRSRHRSSSRERDRRSRDGHGSRHRHRSSSRDRDRDRSERKRRRRSRSRSSSRDRGRMSRSSSPQDQRLEKGRGKGYKDRGESKSKKERNNTIDYTGLIAGYADMTPAERVKAKMKLQLSQTVEKDTTKGVGAGWERFEFNKDAPLDDEEIEAAEDDAVLVKHMGQSFRFSAVEARREEEIKAAHDEAMFGASAAPPPIITVTEQEEQNDGEESNGNSLVTNLMSDKVLAKQQGSWRDRTRKTYEFVR